MRDANPLKLAMHDVVVCDAASVSVWAHACVRCGVMNTYSLLHENLWKLVDSCKHLKMLWLHLPCAATVAVVLPRGTRH